jgi:hypothetical protein
MYEVSGEMIVTLIIIWWLEVMRRLAVSKQVAQKFDGERSHLKNLINGRLRTVSD